MHVLRSSRLARLVAAWFLAWTAVMLSAPLVAPAGMELVCSGGGYQLVSPKGDDAGHLSGHLGQCPACVHLAAPPSPVLRVVVARAQQGSPLFVATSERRDPHPAAPPPARGPPLFS